MINCSQRCQQTDWTSNCMDPVVWGCWCYCCPCPLFERLKKDQLHRNEWTIYRNHGVVARPYNCMTVQSKFPIVAMIERRTRFVCSSAIHKSFCVYESISWQLLSRRTETLISRVDASDSGYRPFAYRTSNRNNDVELAAAISRQNPTR